MNTNELCDTPAMNRGTFTLWVLATTAVALVLRWIRLDEPSFWIDEIYSVSHASQLGQGNITKQLGFIPTYLILKLAGALPAFSEATDPSTWSATGVTEWLVRFPSLVIGVLTIPILGYLARPVVGSRAAVLFMLMLAVNTWHLHMSQTGRFYVQQMLFYNMALLLYYHATTVGSTRRMVLAMVSLFLAFMSQPPALMIGVILGIDWACGLRKRAPGRMIGKAAIAGGITAAVCLLILYFDYSRNESEWDHFGKSTSQSTKVILAGAVWYINPAVALTTVAGFLWLTLRETRLACYLALGSLVPIVLMSALAMGDYFVHVRYTFVALPAWLLLAAVTLDRATRRSIAEYPLFIRGIPVGLIIISCLYQNLGYYTSGGGYRPDWREAFQELDRRRKPGELIYGDFHAKLIGAYYIEEDAIQSVTRAQLIPQLDENDSPSWIIDKVGTGGGLTWQELRYKADLIWTFDRHILQPYSSIKLFRHDPDDEPPGPVDQQSSD